MAYDKETQQFTTDEIYSSRRFGRIDIAEHFIKTDSETVMKVFSELIPTEVQYDYQEQIFRVKGLCKHFDPVDLGSMIPYYQVYIKKEPDETTISFKKK
jgi:hypothetical protein